MAPAWGYAWCSWAAASQDQDRDEGTWASHGSSHGLFQRHFSELQKGGAADMSPAACKVSGQALTSHPMLFVHRIPHLPCPLPASHRSQPIMAQKTRCPGTLRLLQASPCHPAAPATPLQLS